MIPRQLAPDEPGRRPVHGNKTLPSAMEHFRSEIVRLYVAKVASKGTYNRVLQAIYLLAGVGVRAPSEIGDATVRRLKRALPKSNKDATNFAILRSCRAVCQHGVDLGLIPKMPNFGHIPQVNDLPRAKPAFRLSTDDFQRMWNALLGDAAVLEGHRLFAVYATASLAGLRRDELLHLLKDDVDLVGGMIRVRRRERAAWTKLASPVKLSTKLKDVLTQWYPLAGDEIFFPGPTGGYWDGTGSKRVHAVDELKAAGKSLGIRGSVTFEVLRRFYEDNPFAAYELDLPTAIPSAPRAQRISRESKPKLGPNRVVVKGPKDPVWIRGKNKGILTSGRYDPIKVLWDVGDAGVSPADLKTLSKREGAVNAIRDLRNMDEDWRDVLETPGVGYPGSDGRIRLHK